MKSKRPQRQFLIFSYEKNDGTKWWYYGPKNGWLNNKKGPFHSRKQAEIERWVEAHLKEEEKDGNKEPTVS